VQTLFLATALYPEIDAVFGQNPFPDFHVLPYINVVVKESSRWNLVSPLGK
jgi:hypothetical protein